VCESRPGTTVVMFVSASEIIRRHALSPELTSNIQPAEHLVRGVLGQA